MNNPILVTGAAGKLGQRVLHHLTDTLGVAPARIVAASRDPAKLADWAAKGIATRAMDFDRPATLAAAFAGVERALLISTDALDRRLTQHRDAIQAMAAAGVRHAVYTSMPKPENSPLLFAPDHAGTEAALAASPLPGWTVLRNHWYFENLPELYLPPALASGKWYTADNGQGSADLSRDDLALAAAIALSGTATGKKVYTLSGTRALTKVEFAAAVSAAIGRPLEVVQVPLEGLVQGMVAAGLPEPVARVFASFDTNTAAGRVAEVTDDFEQLVGKKPVTFEIWLAANKQVLAAL